MPRIKIPACRMQISSLLDFISVHRLQRCSRPHDFLVSGGRGYELELQRAKSAFIGLIRMTFLLIQEDRAKLGCPPGPSSSHLHQILLFSLCFGSFRVKSYGTGVFKTAFTAQVEYYHQHFRCDVPNPPWENSAFFINTALYWPPPDNESQIAGV